VLSKLGFILYSVVALLIQVPQPSSGTYYIVNSLVSQKTSGTLAATFQGDQNTLTVTTLVNSVAQQVWLEVQVIFYCLSHWIL
jgi:hypothetical protein